MNITAKLSQYKTFVIFDENGDLFSVLRGVDRLSQDLSQDWEYLTVQASTDGENEFADVTSLAAELFLAERDIFEPDTTIQWLVENVTPIPAFVQDWMLDNGWVQDSDDGSDYHRDMEAA